MLTAPLAALFHAPSLAIGDYARSTKEGQYYLLPIFLGTMPLVLFSLAPGMELTFKTSLIPVTGLCLLLQRLIFPPAEGAVDILRAGAVFLSRVHRLGPSLGRGSIQSRRCAVPRRRPAGLARAVAGDVSEVTSFPGAAAGKTQRLRQVRCRDAPKTRQPDGAGVSDETCENKGEISDGTGCGSALQPWRTADGLLRN